MKAHVLATILLATFTASTTLAGPVARQPADEAAEEPAEEPAGPDYSTPEATFQTILQAIQAHDLNTYTQCFSQTAIENDEPQLELAAVAPDPFWTELEAIVNGPQRLIIVERGQETVRGHVEAPEGARGGIGSITFELENGSWKIRSW